MSKRLWLWKTNLPRRPRQSFELSGGKDLSSSFTQTSCWVYQSLPSCSPEWLVWHLLGRAKRRSFRSQPSLCVCRKNILEVHSDRCCFRKHKVVHRAVSGRRWPTFLWACRYTDARSQAASRLVEPTSCPGGHPCPGGCPLSVVNFPLMLQRSPKEEVPQSTPPLMAQKLRTEGRPRTCRFWGWRCWLMVCTAPESACFSGCL